MCTIEINQCLRFDGPTPAFHSRHFNPLALLYEFYVMYLLSPRYLAFRVLINFVVSRIARDEKDQQRPQYILRLRLISLKCYKICSPRISNCVAPSIKRRPLLLWKWKEAKTPEHDTSEWLSATSKMFPSHTLCGQAILAFLIRAAQHQRDWTLDWRRTVLCVRVVRSSVRLSVGLFDLDAYFRQHVQHQNPQYATLFSALHINISNFVES